MDILRLVDDRPDQISRRVFPEAGRDSTDHESDAEPLNDIIGVAVVLRDPSGRPEHHFSVPVDHLAEELVVGSLEPDLSPVVAHSISPHWYNTGNDQNLTRFQNIS